MPSHIKTYDGSKDPEDHLKIFQVAAKTERWAMPTWCHMFNSTLTGNARVWFDDLLAESIDNYDDLKKAFLENYLQQKKYIKDLIELHNIKQRDGESTKDFVRRYKLESRYVKGAPECMRISRFVHGITDLELIKRGSGSLESRTEEIVSTMETTRGYPEAKFKKGGFWNQQRSERKQDRFTLLIKTPKEIFALEKGKFKASPPMTTPVEKRNHTKFCWFLECGYLSLIRMLAESLCLPRMLNSWSGNLRHVVLKSRMFGLYVKTRPMLEEGMVMCYQNKWRLADDATTKTMEAALL
ncbi:reverse transcriptase domain-containing protein [Tanacetum coccineum]